MSTLTRQTIAEMTGLPPTTLSRQLARFPSAKTARGEYNADDPGLRAWLAQKMGGDSATPAASATPRPEPPPDDPAFPVMLPSGILISTKCWTVLRTADEELAIRWLDRLIGRWQLRPHAATPDLLPWTPMTLPSGCVVNGAQWRVLRNGTERRALFALDSLMRSWPTDRQKTKGGDS